MLRFEIGRGRWWWWPGRRFRQLDKIQSIKFVDQRRRILARPQAQEKRCAQIGQGTAGVFLTLVPHLGQPGFRNVVPWLPGGACRLQPGQQRSQSTVGKTHCFELRRPRTQRQIILELHDNGIRPLCAFVDFGFSRLGRQRTLLEVLLRLRSAGTKTNCYPEKKDPDKAATSRQRKRHDFHCSPTKISTSPRPESSEVIALPRMAPLARARSSARMA